MATINGTPGDDTLTGTSGNDFFNLFQGGNDTVLGAGGNDVFDFGAAFTAADTVNGNAGTDTLELKGDYSAGVTFAATTMTGVEDIKVAAGFTYVLTLNDANVASGANLQVNSAALGAGDALNFDGSAETGGHFTFVAGGGIETLTGGAKNDFFDMLHASGTSTLSGGAGNDHFNFAGNYVSGDTIDGGAGSDALTLNGDYSGGLTFGAASLANVEDIRLGGGFDYVIATNDANVASGATLTVNTSALGAGDAANFDGSAETGGRFNFVAADGTLNLTGGGGADVFDMLQASGVATLAGGGGNDHFNFAGNFATGDTIDGGAGTDTVNLQGDYSLPTTFAPGAFTNVEDIALGAGHDYDLIFAAGSLSSQTVTISAAALSSHFSADIDVSALTTTGTHVTGGAGDDTITGAYLADISHGGSDTVTNAEFVEAGGALDSTDHIDSGPSGVDLILNGVYAPGFTITSSMVTALNTLGLAAGNTYDIMLDTAEASFGLQIKAVGATTIDATQMTSGFTFNGATGGAGADDSLIFGSESVLSGSTLDGGDGTNTIVLDGDFSTAFAINTRNFQDLVLRAGHDYDIESSAPGNIDGSALGASDTMTLNLTGTNGGQFNFVIDSGNGSDNITLHDPAVAPDTFIYDDGITLSGATRDIITDFDFHRDLVQFATVTDTGGHQGTNTAINAATFDADLTTAMASTLQAHEAIYLTPNSGDLAGHNFLIVDGNGVAGYQAGADLVIELVDPLNLSDFGKANFTA